MNEEDWAAARAARVRGDHATEARIYRRLADQGDPRAQDNLGVLHERGLGVARSYAEAVKWYRMAAEQGEPNAQNNLGVMYEMGRGVPTDQSEAIINAQHNLGNMYESGHGIAQNYTEAVAWFRKAAERGHPMAQANLGVMYELGHGVPQDLVQAYMWFSLSVAGFPASEAKNRGIATRNRDEIAARMTPSQLADAQKLVRAWRPR